MAKMPILKLSIKVTGLSLWTAVKMRIAGMAVMKKYLETLLEEKVEEMPKELPSAPDMSMTAQETFMKPDPPRTQFKRRID